VSLAPLAAFETGALLSVALPLVTLLCVVLWLLASLWRGAK
jgi:hypothetical protein